jgi:hypothetical protein
MIELKLWIKAIPAHPVTKQPCTTDAFNNVRGVIDARVFLKNTHGFSEWAEGQDEYEKDMALEESSLVEHQADVEGAQPVYEHYQLAGRILDCGGWYCA